MQNKEENIKENMLSVFNTDFPLLSQNGLKKKALEYYKINRFPNLRDEGWRQTNLSPVFNNEYKELSADSKNIDIKPFLIPGLNADVLVFINGFYDENLSSIQSSDIDILSIKKASLSNSDIFKKHFESTEILSENNFTAINTAFVHDGSFIYLGKNKLHKIPVHILNLITGKESILAQSRNLIVAGKNSEISIIESYHSLDNEKSFTNVVSEVLVEENAKVDWVRIQSEQNNANQMNHMRVIQNSNSLFRSNVFTFSGKLVRNKIDVKMNGEGGNSNLYGLYFPTEKQLFDNYTFVNHAVPHCESNQIYKGVIDDDASAVFYGKVLVSKDAQKTNANQSNRNVLLSEGAKINSKPQLEIYADDVACSHGSTVGQLDEEAMFYLQSRGIPKVKARGMLLYGFVSEVVDKIKNEAVKEYVNGLIKVKLGEE